MPRPCFFVRLKRRYFAPACTITLRRAEWRSRLAAGHRRGRRKAVFDGCEQPWDFPDPGNTPGPDSPTTVWRNDHKDPRDRKAHEKFKIVVEDRIVMLAGAEARRLAANQAVRTGAEYGPLR